ncbi:MAG: toll/interleukin-1 receptor domain-containing protein, partial [Chloroflexi bacterium]|nr:toll/interleukin-1 receptor domain-containing protein [Chloroflexota bacterium]
MRAFLSHSSADKPLARKIFRALRDQAVSVWFDTVELRPGDSLLGKISAGIAQSDYLLILITENSSKSRWVQYEVETALTQEIDGIGPIVIPLLLQGVTIPALLARKVYIPIREDGTGIADIIPGIFRDSYILDIDLRATDLEPDVASLTDDLHEFYRSNFDRLRIRINNHNFNQRALELAEKIMLVPGTPPPVAEQVRQKAALFPIVLPLYWTNLSDVLAQLAEEVFAQHGKTLDALKIAATAMINTLRFAQFLLAQYLKSALFPSVADALGFPDLAAYVQRYESVTEAEFMHQLYELNPSAALLEARLDVRAGSGILPIATLYLPDSAHRVQQMLHEQPAAPAAIITQYSWLTHSLPQILGRFLQWSVFRDGKPPYELDYH